LFPARGKTPDSSEIRVSRLPVLLQVSAYRHGGRRIGSLVRRSWRQRFGAAPVPSHRSCRPLLHRCASGTF